jgi:hypothetical protein
MTKSTEKDGKGIYLYGIIRHSGSLVFDAKPIGGGGNVVYTINFKDICAVVSNSDVMRYETRRIHLTAHQLVLEEIMKQFSVLPIRFSTISSSLDNSKIVKILENEYDKFNRLLEEMEGKKELGLKVVALEQPIYNHILEKYDDIRVFKEKLAKLDPEKAHYQLMKIGEMVEKALDKEKEFLKTIMLDVLSPLVTDQKINDNYGERMVLNAAFLIKNEMEPAFDKEIIALDEKYGKLLTFKYVGTLPPYNFVNLVINIQED